MEGLQRCLLCISPGPRDVSSASPCVNSNFLLVLLSSQPSVFPLLLSLLLESGWRFSSPQHSETSPTHEPLYSLLLASVQIVSILIIRQGRCLSCIKISSNSFSKFLWKSPLTIPAVPGSPDKGFVPGAGVQGASPDPAAPGVTAPPRCHQRGLCPSWALHIVCPLLGAGRGKGGRAGG